MSRRGRAARTDWVSYLESFHRERSGITERLLGRSSLAGVDPYEWLASALELTDGIVADVGAGSGPMASFIEGWVGIDTSLPELAVARSRGRRRVVRADASALPAPAGCATAGVLAMSLQVVDDVDAVLTELARVVRPGGKVAVLLPARSPMPWRDTLFYLRLQRRLRRSITYPNEQLLRGSGLHGRAQASGFVVVDDRRGRFELPVGSRADAEELVRSLYLPGVGDARISRAVDLVAQRVGRSLPIPLRRVVLCRSGGEG